MSKVNVGIVQLSCDVDPERNLNGAIREIQYAAGQGANIVCLPELFRIPYPCQAEDHGWFSSAEPVPGPSCERLGEVAADAQVVILASLFEKRAAGIYHNTVAVIDANGQYLGKYRKMHIPDDPLYYEKFYFTPGDLGFQVFPTRFGQLGTLVC